jgi:hypothetical protein
MAERKPKTPKVPGVARGILAAGIAHYIDRRFPDLPNVTQKQLALSKESGIAFSTIQRLMKAEVGANLETVEALAASLRAQMHDLLRPRHFTALPGRQGTRDRIRQDIDRDQKPANDARRRKRVVKNTA